MAIRRPGAGLSPATRVWSPRARSSPEPPLTRPLPPGCGTRPSSDRERFDILERPPGSSDRPRSCRLAEAGGIEMMQPREDGPHVAAIVPAYNEESTLNEVLSVLKATTAIDEI